MAGNASALERKIYALLKERKSVSLFTKVLYIGLVWFGGAGIIYLLGGTRYALPYLMIIPIIWSAAWFNVIAAVFVALAAGAFLEPFISLEPNKNLIYSADDLISRVAFSLLIAFFARGVFQERNSSSRKGLGNILVDKETGLPNRAALNKDLEKYFSEHANNKEAPEFPAIVLLRMQDLWEVIEAMGNKSAEKLIANVSGRISASIKKTHKIYRFSNSELFLLFYAETNSEIGLVAEAARAAGEEESEVNGIPLRVQLVAGSYGVTSKLVHPDVAINRVRTALYSAIDSNTFYRPYNPLQDKKISERVRLISRVGDGLRNKEFSLFYQPKVFLQTGCHAGSEALLRWFRKDGSLIMPCLFMPKLENTSLIHPVTRFIIKQACDDINRCKLRPVSINFSVKNLMDDELVKGLGELVKKDGIDPGLLEIEITERALIRDPVKAKEAILSLRNQGFMVSIDDFGTGYSSLQYLSQLPVSGLKIDRAFVEILNDSSTARTVLKSLVRMAHDLDLEVTIEGVETKKQHEIVVASGADRAQGFYYARPLSLEEYKNWEEWVGCKRSF
ncbi:EAL domain-containing protein [Marinobacter sp.]|uniref:EAL domain-containing protein n=1 Tax=Marinobacter sp. TaxID=50741 RepID=UPI0035668E79